jgi:hypothetical protein
MGNPVIIDSSSTISIGTSTATGIVIGRSGTTTTFPGTVAITGGAINGTNVEGVYDATAYSGADIGAQINAAYAACPSTGCTILVPPGSYSFSTAISIATQNKPALVTGVSTNATILNYTGSGTAITLNCCSNATGLQWGVANFTLTGAGVGNSATGILLGGTYGAFGANLNGLKVSGFTDNIKIASNAWQFKFVRVLSIAASGGSAFNLPLSAVNSGEMPSIRDSVFSGTIDTTYLSNCFVLAGWSSPLSIEDTSFDNCQIVQTAGQTQFVNDHFEDPSGLTAGDAATIPFITMSSGQMQFTNGAFFNDWISDSKAPEFLSISGNAANVTMDGMNFYSTTPLNYCVATSGANSSSLHIRNSIQNGSTACTTFLSNTGSAPVSVGPAAPMVTVETSGTAATYTTPAGALYLEVEMVGGGGGGSGSGTTPPAPGNGINTTFGSLTARGGQGAYYPSNAGGAGGTASGGSVNLTGALGCGSNQYAAYGSGGCGASSFFGGAGTAGGSFPSAGTDAAANTGSGGGGAGSGSVAGSGGGGGAGGYVYAVISTPVLTYTYTVGSGGTGGTAGTSGSAGGNGAAGIIIVTAYFQ